MPKNADVQKSQKKGKKRSDKKNKSKQVEIEDDAEVEDHHGKVQINSNSEDEYDDEADSGDDNFIADEDEVNHEINMEKRQKRQEYKRMMKKQKKSNAYDQDANGVDDEDLELIQENKQHRLRKLRKNVSDEDDQLEQSSGYGKKVKNNNIIDSRVKNEDDYGKGGDVKRQIFEKRGNDSTAAEEDGHPAHLNAAQNLKDKFVCEDIDDLFGTKQDTEIAERDIPERIQIKLSNRLNPSEQEIEAETDWIFSSMITQLAASKAQMTHQDIQNIKNKINKTLKFFRCENNDIPFITRYKMNELIPELEYDDIWRIFNMDMEYGKFQIQKKQCEEFFTKISEFGNSVHMEHYKNQIHHTKNQRDLNDFQPLINFYKSFYQKELESVAKNTGKKLPVPKREFVFNARQKRLDHFSRRCLLSPIEIVENINEDKQMHKPTQPTILAVEMAKEYANANLIKDAIDQKKAMDIYLDVLKEMCLFAAAELQSQPDIRRGLKKHIYDNGVLQTQPTDKGKKELDVFHPSYRVKRLNKKLSDMKENDTTATDLFLDVMQNESIGLITYDIVIKDDCEDPKIGNKFFQNMYEKYKFPDDSSQWNLVRREIFQLFSSFNTNDNKGQKSFLSSIKDEIKEELKEDAETYVLTSCGEKYRDMVKTGYFKIQAEGINPMQQKDKKPGDDVIQQRDRLIVLGAIMHPIDMRSCMTEIAVVDKNGELIEHMEFYHIIPPRKPKMRDGVSYAPRPGEVEEQKKHIADRTRFQNILKEHEVDLIVVCADCLEAKKLKKTLEEFANFKGSQGDGEDDQNDDDKEMQENDDDGMHKEAFVIWGRPEIPKLFASSHYSQKLLKNQPFILKKAISLARYEQDPMNEILNLWSPIQSENQALQLNLHPNQKHINQSRLMETLEEINIQTVNEIGIDINLLAEHEHWHNQLQFLSGLGPRKAQRFIQKLKSLGNPLYTRNDIHQKKILKKNCFDSSLGFIKIRVKNNDERETTNILDQTRIHYKFYDKVYKLVTDFLFEKQPDVEQYKKQAAVVTLIKDSEKLKEFAEGQYKEQLKKIDNPQVAHIFNQIMEDLMHPFTDPREKQLVVRTPSDQKFTNEELFYCLIDETTRSFKRGMITSATVIRVFEARPDSDTNFGARILCKLENGLDANIFEKDTDIKGNLVQTVAVGSIITGRVDRLKFDEKMGHDDTFSITLNCKKQNLTSHAEYIDNIEGEIPEEDLININFKTQEDQMQNQQKAQIQKRKIQHQRFQNIASTRAISLLTKEDVGEFYFRPSSKGNNNLTLTWKFYESNVVHIDIKELEKAPGANIGSKLQISDEVYENLQEIVERYILPCNRSLREVTNHPKFQKCTDLDELKKSLDNEKSDDNSRIPYKFTVLEKYPQYVILAYVPKKDIVKEFIKVKPRGFFFHHQYHYPFQNMINWFKQEFRTKDYQRYLRKTSSPQLAIGAAALQKQGQSIHQNPSNVPYKSSGMQIDSGGGAWGADAGDVKNEDYRGRRDDRGGDNVKDERERGGGGGAWGGDGGGGGAAWGNDGGRNDYDMQSPGSGHRGGRGGGRGGRGGGDRGPMTCYNCQGEGHQSRDCTEPRKERSGGGDRGPMKCFNCQGEGHQSRDCTEPRKERNDRGPMKCYNCQGEGHQSRDCTEPRQERRDGGRGGGDGGGGDRRGPMKCYNCQGEGHMSRECPEPKKERGGGGGGFGGDDRGGYKRQRRDDDRGDEGFGQKDTQSAWNKGGGNDWGNEGVGGGQNNWNADAAKKDSHNSQDGGGGGGWGESSQNNQAKKSSQDGFGGGGGNNDGGWGNEPKNNSQDGGWNNQ